MCNAHNHSPDCTCGFGGEGHSGWGGWNYGERELVVRNYIYSEKFKDVCYPTKCPVKGCQPVWFIRHNGGSVWLDKLGWPWPKHGCIYETSDDDAYAFVTALANKQESPTHFHLGLLNSMSDISSQQGPKLQIGSLDGSLSIVRGAPYKNYHQLLGELVIFSKEVGLIRHSTLGDFPIFPLRAKKEWVQCKCNCWVEKANLEGHLRTCRCNKPETIREKVSSPQNEQNRVQFEIERIIKEAQGITASQKSKENLQVVIKEAMRLIRNLSPDIRRDVERYFSSHKWAKLLKKNR
jgi:hypothetical protein